MSQSGIYTIMNTVDSHLYVGSAVDFAARKRVHLHGLRHNKHHSPYLQRAYNKHGEAAFVFTLIEELPRDKELLSTRETYWIQTLKPQYNGNTVTATRLGMTNSELTRQKLREYAHRPEVIAKKKADLTGHEVLPETREKIKEARAKQPITDAMLKSLELGRAIPHSQRKGMTGRHHSEETLLKMSATAKGRKPSPLAIQNSLETRRLKRLKAQQPDTLWD